MKGSSGGAYEDHGAPVNDWVNVVRRARLGPNVKPVALTIASYADPDGTHVFPGVARLAVQCELKYRTVQYALATLRKAGLIEVVRHGSRRNGKSDEYRLILAADLLKRCDVPTPAAERLEIERVTGQNQARQEKSRIRRTRMRLEPVDNQAAAGGSEAVQTHPGASENGFRRTTASTSDAPGCVPPSIDLSSQKQPPSDEGGLRTPRTGSAREAEEAERKRQIDGLAEWEGRRPGAGQPTVTRASCPRCGQDVKVMKTGFLWSHGPRDPQSGDWPCHRVLAPAGAAP